MQNNRKHGHTSAALAPTETVGVSTGDQSLSGRAPSQFFLRRLRVPIRGKIQSALRA